MAGGSGDSRQINRSHSPVLARAALWVTVMLASLLQTLPMISSAPLVPPLGFLADKALRGTPAGTIPVTTSDPVVQVNLRQAQAMGLTVPDGLLRQAKEIVR